MKRAVVSVINDLVTDQRVHKVSLTLQKLGYEVLLVGRRQKKSLLPGPRNYSMHRMKLLVEKGPLFYLAFNFRLFFFLLFSKADLLVSNDLDTLLPNYLVSRLKKKPLVYDTHEIFTEVPELQNRPLKKAAWRKLEKLLLPRLKHVFTVNRSLADWYAENYGIRLSVVRNIPTLIRFPDLKSRTELGLPLDKKIIILQGAGINIERGGEELLEAMLHSDNLLLLIIGSGDVIPLLKERASHTAFAGKVRFIDSLPYNELMQYTRNADLGLSMDKDSNLNYRYSLPNKLFDYIHAGIPVLASRLPELEAIIRRFDVGDFIDDHRPQTIAVKIKTMLDDSSRMEKWKENCRLAAEELNWENEEKELIRVYEQYR